MLEAFCTKPKVPATCTVLGTSVSHNGLEKKRERRKIMPVV